MSDNAIEIRITGAVDSSLAAAITAAVAQAASGLKTVESATDNLHFATAGVIEDYFRLGQAVASGNFSSIAGTLVNLGKETGLFDAALEAMGTEAAAATGGIALLAGALGDLVYKAIENGRELDNLTASFAASGRAALASANDVRAELYYLQQIPGASREAAQGLAQYAAVHPSIDPAIFHQTAQLTEHFKQLLGKDGPQAVGRLAEALSNLTKDGFDKLQHDLLNLPTDQFERIRSLIGTTGHEVEAANQILAAYGKTAGASITSYGDQIRNILHDIDQLKKGRDDNLLSGLIKPRLATVDAVGDLHDNHEDEIALLDQELVHIRALQAAQGEAGQAAKNRYEADYAAAEKSNNAHHEELGLQQALTKAKSDYDAAVKRGDTKGPNSGAAVFGQAVKDAQAHLDAFHKRSYDKTLQDFVASQDAMVAATKSGSQARIDADQREMDRAAQLFGKNSQQYHDLQIKKGEAQRAASEQGAQIAAASEKVGAEESISAARDASQEILSSARLNASERGALAKQIWDLLSNGDQLNADQRAQAATALAQRIAREEGLSAEQQKEVEAQLSSILVGSAQLTAQQRAQAVRDGARAESDARRQAGRDVEQIDRLNQQATVDAAKDAYELTSTLEDRKLAYFQETESEKIAALKAAKQDELQVEIDGYQLQLDALIAANQKETPLYLQLHDKIAELNRQKNLAIQQSDTQAAQQAVKNWQSIISPIESGMSSMVSSLIGGQTKFGAATRQLLVQVVSEWVSARIKVEFDWLAGRLAMELGDQKWAQKSLLEMIFGANEQVAVTEQTEAEKAAAVAAGGQAQVSWMAMTSAEGQAITAEAGSESIMNDAYEAAASAFKWVIKMVPFPLNAILAPVAAGAAFTAVAAYDTLTSAEGGLERVDSAEKLMVTHRDESVLPARISRPLMAFVGDLPAMAELVKQNSVPAFGLRAATPDLSGSLPGSVARAAVGSPDLRSIADVGSLIPVMSPGASVRAAQRTQVPQSDADYVASRVGGGGRASAAPSPAPSKTRGGDIHIHAWDASSMNQFFRKPANRRTMDQISKDRARAGFVPG